MQNEIHELFLLATNFFYKKYKNRGGSQGDLAYKLGITNSYLSSVINGSRKASLDLQNQIANTLYGSYDKFLLVGRRIKEGHEPLPTKKRNSDDPVEKLLAQLTHYVIDHKRIENELQLSQEKFRDISLTSGDMIFELDKNFNFVFISGKVQEVTGRTPDDIIGKNIADFTDEKELARLHESIQDSIRKRIIMDTVINEQYEGEVFYRRIISKPFYSRDGSFKGCRGTYRDITKRKALENDLEQQNWLLQVALDSVTHCAIVISDAQNKVLKWNIEYKRLFSHSEAVLKTRDTLIYIKETRSKVADPEQFDRDVKEVLQSRKEIIHTFQLLDGRTIERKVLPLYKNDVLLGRIAHLMQIS